MAEPKTQKYVDQDTGKIVTFDERTYDYLSDVPSAKTNGPRYTPVSGSVQVAVQDNNGDVHVQDMDADSYFKARRGGATNITRLDESNRELAQQLHDEAFQRRTEQQRADSAGALEVFGENFIPGVRSMQRIGLTDEQSARHARIQELEDQGHPVAAGLGDAAQLIATSMIPIPGLRGASKAIAGRTAERAAGQFAGDVWALGNKAKAGATLSAKELRALGLAQERAQTMEHLAMGGRGASLSTVPEEGVLTFTMQRADLQPETAMNLLGFSRAVGDTARTATALRGAGGLPAQLAGSVAAGATINLPLSIQYEAAQIVDYDKPLAADAFVRDVGTDLLLGMALDVAFPLLGRGARTVFKALPSVHAAQELAGVGAKLVAGKNGRKPISILVGALDNNTKRTVAKKAVDEGMDATVKHSRALKGITPSVAKTGNATTGAVSKIPGYLDNLAAVTKEVTDLPEFSYLKENYTKLAGTHKTVPELQRGLSRTADEMAGHMTDLRLGNVSFKGHDPALRADFAVAGNRIIAAIDEEFAPYVQKYIGGLESFAGAPAKGAERLLSFRNTVVLDAAAGDPAASAIVNAVKSEVDALLTNPSRVGDAAENMRVIINASDDVANAVSVLRDTGHLNDLDTILLPEDAKLDAIKYALLDSREGYRMLNNNSTLLGNNKGYAEGTLGKKLADVTNVEPQLEAVRAANKIRVVSADKLKAVVDSGVDATEAGLIRRSVESVGRYIENVKEAAHSLLHVDTAIKRGWGTQAQTSVLWSMKTNGVWRFRNMKTREEKRAAFNEIRAALRAVTANPDTLSGAAEAFTGSLQKHQELAGATAFRAIQKLQYLANQLPQAPQGMVAAPDYEFSPAEESAFLEIYGAADDPVSVMESIGNGSLTDDAIRTIAKLYPGAYTDMQGALSEGIMADPESYRKLPFAVRSDLDRFLGGGYVQANQPSSFINYQPRSGQTRAQHQALRGGTAQPGVHTGSDNLSKL